MKKVLLVLWNYLPIFVLFFYCVKFLIYPETITNIDIRWFSVLSILVAIHLFLQEISKNKK